jgi:hypothetical protein
MTDLTLTESDQVPSRIVELLYTVAIALHCFSHPSHPSPGHPWLAAMLTCLFVQALVAVTIVEIIVDYFYSQQIRLVGRPACRGGKIPSFLLISLSSRAIKEHSK